MRYKDMTLKLGFSAIPAINSPYRGQRPGPPSCRGKPHLPCEPSGPHCTEMP
jgi:hypothetical protein